MHLNWTCANTQRKWCDTWQAKGFSTQIWKVVMSKQAEDPQQQLKEDYEDLQFSTANIKNYFK